jgi:hypothetical protein
MRSTNKALTAAAAFLAISGAWPAIAGADPGPAPAPAPGPKTTIDTDGTYAVGTQIAAGSYSTAGPVGSGVCSYKVAGNGKVIDSVFTKKPQVVTLGADATSFKTDGCQPWQPADCSAGCGTPEGSPSQILGQLGAFLLPRMGSAAPAGTPPPADPPN